MKALLCRSFGPITQLQVEAVDSPPLSADQVRISVKAAGINFPDALVVQGQYQLKPAVPFSPGSEFAGIVSEVGTAVDDFAPGDRVFGLTSFGAYAEEVVTPASRLHRMSEQLTFEEAAVISMAYGSSMHALFDRGRLQRGETLVVLGATGGVGLAAVELGHLAGARVLAVDQGDERLRLATDKGATAVFNTSSGGLREAVDRFTEGQGADVILDTVGGELGENAVRCLAWRGRLLVFGFASGTIPRIQSNLLLLKSADALGVFWGESQRRGTTHDKDNFKKLLTWHTEGKITPHISRRFPLAEGVAALTALVNREIVGKAVITMD